MVEVQGWAPTGAGPTDRAARSVASTIIRSSTSPTAMRRLTRNGRARNCRPKPNGSLPRAGGLTAPSSPGATISHPAGNTAPIRGRESFRTRNWCDDGFPRTSPVAAFPPNGYGIYDMIGNTWEWTADWYAARHEVLRRKDRAVLQKNPRGGREDQKLRSMPAGDQNTPQGHQGRLAPIAPNYCRRYRPAARHAEAVDTSTSHLGLRCVVRKASEQWPKLTEASLSTTDDWLMSDGAGVTVAGPAVVRHNDYPPRRREL